VIYDPAMPIDHRSTITHRGPVFDVEVIEFADEGGRSVRRDIVRHPGAVTIIPALDDGRLVLIRNHRVSIGSKLLEFPAGKLERAEPPEQAAARELVEETGYQAIHLERIGSFYTSPGLTDECMHTFLATGLTHVGQRLEPGELIDVKVIPAGEVERMAADGRIRDGKTLASLYLWLAHERRRDGERGT